MHKTLKLNEKNEIKQIETKKYSCPKVRYGRKFVSSFMTISFVLLLAALTIGNKVLKSSINHTSMYVVVGFQFLCEYEW